MYGLLPSHVHVLESGTREPIRRYAKIETLFERGFINEDGTLSSRGFACVAMRNAAVLTEKQAVLLLRLRRGDHADLEEHHNGYVILFRFAVIRSRGDGIEVTRKGQDWCAGITCGLNIMARVRSGAYIGDQTRYGTVEETLRRMKREIFDL